MADKTNSQAQQNGSIWGETMAEQMGKVTDFWMEMGKAEGVAYERAKVAVEEMSKLSNATLAFCAQRSADWREMALEATRHTTAFFSSLE